MRSMNQIDKELPYPAINFTADAAPAQDQGLEPLGHNSECAKKLKRILANREYSQRYRTKQLHYITSLESELKSLQAKVSIIISRINHVCQQNSVLRAEILSAKPKLFATCNELVLKQVEFEELKKEREIMKQYFMSLKQRVQGFEREPTDKNNDVQNLDMNQYASDSILNIFNETVVQEPQTRMNRQNPNHFGDEETKNLLSSLTRDEQSSTYF